MLTNSVKITETTKTEIMELIFFQGDKADFAEQI